jgi:predicted nucleic acid-binding protein
LSNPLRIVIDASSLIVLARLNALTALHETYGVAGLTLSVYEEVVIRGGAKGIPDAQIVEAAVARGELTVFDLSAAEKRYAQSLLKRTLGLSQTDCETLACAHDRGLTLLMEDRRGRNAARANKIPYVTIQVFPLYGFIAGRLTITECDALLIQIGQAMNTDLAVLEALRTAARALMQARRKD